MYCRNLIYSIRLKFCKNVIHRTSVFVWLPYWLVFILIAGLIAGILAFTVRREEKICRDRVIETTQNIAHLLDQTFSSEIEKIDVILQMVVTHYQNELLNGHVGSDTFNAHIDEYKQLIPEVLTLRVVDKHGVVRFGIQRGSRDHVSINDRDLFRQFRNNSDEGLIFGAPVQDRISKQWAVGLARRLNTSDGKFSGIAYAYIGTEYFQKILSSLKLGSTGAVTVRMADLALVHRYPETPFVGSKVVSDQLRSILNTESIQGGYIAKTALDNVERINTYRKLQRYPFIVIVGLSTEEFQDDWKRSVFTEFSLGALAIALTAFSTLLVFKNARRQETEIAERKVIEAGLHETQAELLEVQRLAHVGSWVWDIVNDEQECSEEILAIYGLHSSALLPRYPDVRKYFAPNSWVVLNPLIESCRTKGIPYKCDAEIVRTDGERRWVAIFGEAVRDGSGSIVLLRGSIQDITERKKLECDRREYSERLTMLSRHLVTIQEDSRRRLAASLHDRTSPNLAAIAINMDIAAIAIQEGDLTELSTRLEDNRALVEDTANGIREICADLRPPALDHAGIVPAIEAYINQFSRRTGVVVKFDYTSGRERLSLDLESLLFRLVQEALTNVAKHAKALSVIVNLKIDTWPITLTIVDDGQGFDPESIRLNRGLGITNMQEMSEFSGGTFEIDSSPGGGTRIHIEINPATIAS